MYTVCVSLGIGNGISINAKPCTALLFLQSTLTDVIAFYDMGMT